MDPIQQLKEQLIRHPELQFRGDVCRDATRIVFWMRSGGHEEMPEWPHEYLVRERVDEQLFERTVEHIRSNGYALMP